MSKAVQGNIQESSEVHVAKDITPIKRAPENIKDSEAKIRAMWEEDSKPVRGIFRRHDGNNDPLEFSFLKYRWDKLTKYKLVPGNVHTIPLGVAKHLNDDCKTPIYGSLTGIAAADASSREAPIVGYNNRFSFSGLDFSTQIKKEE